MNPASRLSLFLCVLLVVAGCTPGNQSPQDPAIPTAAGSGLHKPAGPAPDRVNSANSSPKSMAERLEMPFPDGAAEKLATLLDELERWNKKVNLTAIRDPAEMIVGHLLDSLVAI